MELTRDNLAMVTRIARGNTSLRTFAKFIGSNAPTLQRVEAGEVPSVATFARICLKVGLPVHWESFIVDEPAEVESRWIQRKT